MMEETRNLLMSYIKANVAPILVDFISGNDIPGAIVLQSNINIDELNGHYEGCEYLPPKWYNELTTKNSRVLVIDLIDTLNKEEQLKFIELLEYRKVSTFELPKDCVIIVTAKDINKDKISEEIYSLVAHIKG